MEQLIEASSAGVAGMIATTSVYPLEVVKTNMQAQTRSRNTAEGASARTERPKSIADVVREVYTRDGAEGFYAGSQIAAVQAFIEKFVYFYTYSGLKELYSRLTGGLSLKATLLIGYVSDWSHLALTMPAEQIAVRMQTKQSGSVLDALSAIVAEKGVLGLYRGIAAYVVLGLKPAIQLTVFEALKKRVLARATGSAASGLSAAQAFAIGAIARAVATVLVFPCTRAKVLMMTSAAASAQAEGGTHGGGPGTQPSAPARTSVLQLLLQSVRDEGPLSLYQGIKPELVRGVLSSAVMLMAKEKIAAANRSAIEALLRPAPSAQHRVGAATPSTPRAPAGPRSSSSAI